MKSFAGKVAVVTGGGAGIGQALVLALLEEGASVGFCDVTDGSETLALAEGRPVCFRSVDVSDREAMARFIEEVIDTLGPVDLLINNAGIALGDRTFEEVTFEDLQRITNINYWGVIHTTKLLYEHLLSRPEAAIVNLSSSQGILATAYLVPYCTTKFAVRGFTDALRVEHEVRGIRHVSVHTVHPGAVATNITLNADYHGVNTQPFHETIQGGVTPASAAQTILRGVRRGRSRIFVGDGGIQDWVTRLVPTRIGTLVRWLYKARGIGVR